MVVSRKRLISVRVNLVCYSFSDRPIVFPVSSVISDCRWLMKWSRNSFSCISSSKIQVYDICNFWRSISTLFPVWVAITAISTNCWWGIIFPSPGSSSLFPLISPAYPLFLVPSEEIIKHSPLPPRGPWCRPAIVKGRYSHCVTD